MDLEDKADESKGKSNVVGCSDKSNVLQPGSGCLFVKVGDP